MHIVTPSKDQDQDSKSVCSDAGSITCSPGQKGASLPVEGQDSSPSRLNRQHHSPMGTPAHDYCTAQGTPGSHTKGIIQDIGNIASQAAHMGLTTMMGHVGGSMAYNLGASAVNVVGMVVSSPTKPPQSTPQCSL